MSNKEARELTTQAAATASSLAVIDEFGNVVCRYHDQTMISKNPRHAAMLLDVIGKIMSEAEAERRAAPPTPKT
jgi:hypothetical protein